MVRFDAADGTSIWFDVAQVVIIQGPYSELFWQAHGEAKEVTHWRVCLRDAAGLIFNVLDSPETKAHLGLDGRY